MAMASAAASQPDLPVDLLEEILLRLDDAADLIRASAACGSFRRLISDGRFLRRFRSLHRPPILGLLLAGTYDRVNSDDFSFYSAEPPHRSAPSARALARAADFSASSLPAPIHYWRVRDVRDRRVLLSRCGGDSPISMFTFECLMVYDPLHRRRVQVPAIPHDLLAAVGHGDDWRWQEFNPFLVPAAADEDDLSFQVMCNVVSEHKVETFLYSSVTREWHGVASFSIGTHEWIRDPMLMDRHCAHGCFYWTDYSQRVMLVLDTLGMNFSVVDLPPESKEKDKSIVEAADGRLGLLVLHDFEFHLYSKARQDHSGGVGTGEWRHDSTIPLPNCYWYTSNGGGASEGYVLVRGIPLRGRHHSGKFPEKKLPDAQYFTLQLKTLQFERLCDVLKLESKIIRYDYLYASFPPPLSPPSI